MIPAITIFWLLFAVPVSALEFNLPNTARQTVARDTAPDIYDAPVGVFAEGTVPIVTVEGDVRRSAWRLDSPGLTPFQVMRPLREQLIAAGFEVVLDCRAVTCGGFDFRFATETLPGPNMYVNIRAYQFVTGQRVSAGKVSEVVTLLASTSATSAYVQIIHAGTIAHAPVSVETSADPLRTATVALAIDGFGERLVAQGHAALSDLDFPSGSSDLGVGPFATLVELAAFLATRSDLRVALVGHTDTVGGLEANIAISRARAQSVRQRLISSYDIAPSRLDAEGMGYLAPVASNLDAAGRDQNRRVEVVVLGEL